MPCAQSWQMKIWIVGYSLCFGAEHWVAIGIGTQLAFSQLFPIQWHGLQRLLWDQLVPALSEALKTRCQRNILILHLSKNDMVDCSAQL